MTRSILNITVKILKRNEKETAFMVTTLEKDKGIVRSRGGSVSRLKARALGSDARLITPSGPDSVPGYARLVSASDLVACRL